MGEPSQRRSTGGCLCGAVRYQVNGPLRDVENCHCSRCRRTHGHFAAYTAAPTGALTIIEERGLRWYVADGRERGFCAECGASLFWRRAGSEQTSIAAGTLDAPTRLHTALHLFVDSRGDYYEITDELPQHPGSGEQPAYP
ncbi:MAG: GFA family protein [Solirubrobacteraceae bacterium]